MQVVPVFLSVDPQRDGVEQVRAKGQAQAGWLQEGLRRGVAEGVRWTHHWRCGWAAGGSAARLPSLPLSTLSLLPPCLLLIHSCASFVVCAPRCETT